MGGRVGGVGGARQGFGAALVETLACFPAQVAPEAVLDLVGEAMQLSGSSSGAEERDMLYGRLFGCAAVVHSQRLGGLADERRAAVARRLSAELVGCMGRKSFLQELGAKLLCELIAQLPVGAIQGSVWPQLAAQLEPPMAEWTPHALLLDHAVGEFLPDLRLLEQSGLIQKSTKVLCDWNLYPGSEQDEQAPRHSQEFMRYLETRKASSSGGKELRPVRHSLRNKEVFTVSSWAGVV